MPDLVEQLRELSQLHQDGSLSDTEFEAAKSRLLRVPSSPAVPSPSLLSLQNELAALDRQWLIERDKYGPGRHLAHSSIPRIGRTGGRIFAGFGAIWMLFALTIVSGATRAGAPVVVWLFPLFGLAFVVIGLTQGAELDRKAEAYKVAEANYQAKRARIEKRVQAQL